MAADPVLAHNVQDTQPVYDNDNAELRSLDLSALARQAAWGLVEHHQKGNPVEIRSRGTADHVFTDLTTQFLSYGTNRVIAEHLAQALVDEAIDRASEFRGKVQQDYIGVSAIVADTLREDMYQFETGHTEVIIVDKESANVAGSTDIVVTWGISGTNTTSNRPDLVSQVVASGKKWGLYIIEEAPGKEELDGIEAEMQAALAAIGAEMGAGMDGEGLRAVIEQLQELGIMTPEIESMLASLVMMSEYAALEQTPEVQAAIAELSETLMEQITAALESGNIPLPLLQGMAEYLNNLAETHGLESAVDLKVLSELRQDIQKAVLVEKLEALAEGLDLDEEALAELKSMIEELKSAEGIEIKKQLDAIAEHLETLDIPVEQMEMIAAEVQKLDDLVVSNLPLEQKIEFLSELAADDLLALLQELDGLDPENLPPELAEILAELTERLEAQGLDLQDLSVEQLKEILAEKGELAATIQNLVLALNDPNIQAALPQATLNNVVQFLDNHSDFVEAVSVQAVISNLQNALEAMDPDSPEAARIEKIIENLKEGETLDAVDPAVLEKVAEILGDQAPPQLAEVVAIVENAKADPVVIGADTVAALEVMAQSGELTAEQAALVEQILQDPKAVAPDLVEQATQSLGEQSPPELLKQAVQVTTAAQISAIPDLLPAEAQKITTAVVTNNIPALAQSSAENQAVFKALPPSVQTQVIETQMNTMLPALTAQQPRLAASIQTLLESQKPNSPVKIHPAKIEMLKQDLAKADLPPAQKQAIQNLAQAVSNQLEGTPPPKPGCSPICNCHNAQAAGESNSTPAQLDNGRSMHMDKEGNFQIKNDKGEVVTTITKEQADQMRIVNDQLVQEYRQGINYESEQKLLDAIKSSTVHVCGPGCDHGGTGEGNPLPPDMSVGDYARITETIALSGGVTSDTASFFENARANIAAANNPFSVSEEENENLQKEWQKACEGDCGTCQACKPEESNNAPKVAMG